MICTNKKARCGCGKHDVSLVCDFVVGLGPRRTCDLLLCATCATEISDNRHFCPQHVPGVQLEPLKDGKARLPLLGLNTLQPYASALVGVGKLPGPKGGENRGWRPPSYQLFKGVWMAVHAGVTVYQMDYGGPITQEHFTVGQQGFDPLWPEIPEIDTLPRGSIVGLAQFDQVIHHEDDDPFQGDPWLVGPEIWMFKERFAFEHPIPYRGAKGLWKVEGRALDLCREELVKWKDEKKNEEK